MAGDMKGETQRKILILLDSPEVRSEITSYSVELARRMRAKLYLLMLLRWETPPHHGAGPGTLEEQNALCERGERVLTACIDEIRCLGMEAVGMLRQGDPASELLKYLAESRPFQAVIWGGKEAFLRRKRIPIRGHWLERVREQLDCALVVPSLKRKREGLR